MADSPDIVLIGHVARDRQPDGSFRLGGTVTYAALLAQRHGLRVGVVTSGRAADLAELAALVPDAAIAGVPAPTATIFENTYHNGQRTQYLRARAAPITPEHIPAHWRAAPITLLGPIADEIAPDVAACLSGPSRAATPQGWLRAWDADGRVQPIPWRNAAAIVPQLTALILSREDLARAAGAQDSSQTVEAWATQIPYVALTDGPRPATLWAPGIAAEEIPACAAHEVDPTGAGDCFAIAFLIALWRTGDPRAATRYAHAAAACAVEAPGVSGVPTPEEIATRLEV